MSISVAIAGPVSLGFSVTDVVKSVTAVASAQNWGSALMNRPSQKPLYDLIRAINGDMDLPAKRFGGSKVYSGKTGEMITMSGEIKRIVMEEISSKDGEELSALGTIINCLSTAMTHTTLSAVVATIIVLCSNGSIEPSMEVIMQALEGKIMTYANAVLSRGSMCNIRETAKETMTNILRIKLPEHLQYLRSTVFLPPRSEEEERDYAVFCFRVMSSRADNEEINTRSAQLFGMALLLSYYGWFLSISVEDSKGIETNVVAKSSGLLVRLSMETDSRQSDREYLENHTYFEEFKRANKKAFYPTATCTVSNMAHVLSLTVPNSPDHSRDFQRGFECFQQYFREKVELKVSVKDTKIQATLKYQPRTRGSSTKLSSCQRLLENTGVFGCLPQKTVEIMANALHTEYPNYDWDVITDEMPRQPYGKAPIRTMACHWTGESGKLWTIIGAISGMFDMFVKALINVSERRAIRVISGFSFQELKTAQQFVDDLLDTGMPSGEAALFCACWLGGVNPNDHRMSASVDRGVYIGYWNGEQGILLTTMLERSLECDLPEEKRRPFTLHNIPILGMPTEDGGWIRPAFVPPFSIRMKNPTTTPFSPNCDVTLEYRPHFGGDSNTVAAALYVNGVYFGLCSTQDMLRATDTSTISYCDHPQSETQDPESNVSNINLTTLDPGTPVGLRNDSVGLIGPQFSAVSRLVSFSIYQVMFPVIRNGCVDCAYKLAQSGGSGFIIDKLSETDFGASMNKIVLK